MGSRVVCWGLQCMDLEVELGLKTVLVVVYFYVIIIIIEGLSLLQSIPPTTADKVEYFYVTTCNVPADLHLQR